MKSYTHNINLDPSLSIGRFTPCFLKSRSTVQKSFLDLVLSITLLTNQHSKIRVFLNFLNLYLINILILAHKVLLSIKDSFIQCVSNTAIKSFLNSLES
jgi:hypothetical protein